MRIIGIDLGTSSIEAILYQTDSSNLSGGVILNSKTAVNHTQMEGDSPSEDLQNGEQIVFVARKMIDSLIDESDEKIDAIALTGQMHGILYIDSYGKAISPLITWRDQRGTLPSPGNSSGESLAQEMSRLSGYPCSTGFGLTTHFANLKKQTVPSQASSIATIADYTAMTLSGFRRPKMDPTNAASLGVFQVKTGEFDFTAINRAGIDPAILPKVIPFGPIGEYREIPLFTPIGDNQAGYYGAVMSRQATIHLMVGTSAQVSFYSQNYLTVEGLETRPFPGRGFLLVGAALMGGSLWALLAHFFEEILSACGNDTLSRDQLYNVIEKLALAGFEKQDFWKIETTFAGTRQAPNQTGSIAGIRNQNFHPTSLAAGIVAGLVEELYQFYGRLPESIRLRQINLIGSGNGLLKNQVLRHAIEKRFGMTLILSDSPAMGAIGAVRLAEEYLTANR